MKRIKMMGLCLAAVFAMGAVTAGAASAAEPTFHFQEKPLTANFPVSGTSGKTFLWVRIFFIKIHIECEKDKFKLILEPKGKTKNLTIVLEKCHVIGHPGCNVTIVIKTLKDQLWWIVGSGKKAVADVLEPETGTEIGSVTLEKGTESCPVEGKAAITGSVGGEASPVNSEAVTVSLLFKAPGEKQEIKEVENETEKKTVKMLVGEEEAQMESTEEAHLEPPNEGEKFGVFS